MNGSLAKRVLLAAAAMAALLVLAACSGGAEPTPEPTPTPVPPAASDAPGMPDAPSSVMLELPDLEISAYQGLDALGGEDTTLSAVVGQGKPVVLNFWAALCPPCRAELPEFERVHHERSDEVTILGIDIGPQQFLGTREEGQALLAELGVSFPAGTTFDDTVVRGFEVFSMPTTFFIASDGSLMRKWSGILDEDKLNELVDELVIESAVASAQASAAGLPDDDFV